MKFGDCPVDQAAGSILAHSLRLPDRSLKKGRVLGRADVSALADAGYRTVVVATLEADDVDENRATQILAQAIATDSTEVRGPFAGRCNLTAREHGVLVLDQEGVDRINFVDESLTLATLPRFSCVASGQLVATVKAIPFAVAAHHVDTCLRVAREHAPLLDVAPFAPKKIGLIQTRFDDPKTRVLEKTGRVLRSRLLRLGNDLAAEIHCRHSLESLVEAINECRESDLHLLIIAAASAVVDRRDVIPAAIEAAGGEVIHFGMPVDPGNLLLLGRRDAMSIVGMPGCARSPKLNGFDMVLERLIADIPVTARDIMRMGAGGLLKEIGERPQPRSIEARTRRAPVKPRINALVLAGGQSRRMGKRNKLLMDIDGRPMVEHVVAALRAAGVEDVVVVTGHQRERIESVLKGLAVRFVHNAHHAQGLSTSLVTGLQAVDRDADAVLVCLGDMPRVSAEHVARLIAAFDPGEGREICVPTYRGKRGNPILWPRRTFSEMLQIRGDVGAKHLLVDYRDVVCEVPMPDSGVLIDFDTELALTGIHDHTDPGSET